MTDWKAAGAASDGKADTGKSMMSLLMVQFGDLNKQVADVLTYGADKYPKPPLHDSWKEVPDADRRYIDALYRHLHAVFVEGEELDQESMKHHFAHAICNLHFLYELAKMDKSGTRPPARTGKLSDDIPTGIDGSWGCKPGPYTDLSPQ